MLSPKRKSMHDKVAGRVSVVWILILNCQLMRKTNCKVGAEYVFFGLSRRQKRYDDNSQGCSREIKEEHSIRRQHSGDEMDLRASQKTTRIARNAFAGAMKRTGNCNKTTYYGVIRSLENMSFQRGGAGHSGQRLTGSPTQMNPVVPLQRLVSVYSVLVESATYTKSPVGTEVK